MRRTLIAGITFVAGLYYLITFVLPPFLGGDFDNLRTYDPCVLKTDGKYLMWYGGYYDESSMGIGLAESTDGLEWEKHGRKPVLGKSSFSSYEGMGIFSPKVLNINGKHVMYYIGRGADNISRIMMATSGDGYSWGHRRKVLDLSDPAVKWSKPRLNCLHVVKAGDLYRMWFMGTYIWKGEAISGISYATSRDGTNWELHDKNPVFRPGTGDGSWKPTDIVSISVIRDSGPEASYRMWYLGTTQRALGKNNYVAFGAVGYATSTDGKDWETHEGNPVFAPVYRFPDASEIAGLDEESTNTALDRVGYNPDVPLEEKKHVLEGVVMLLANSVEPFKDWSDDQITSLLKQARDSEVDALAIEVAEGPQKLTGMTAEKYIQLIRLNPQPPAEMTREEKKDPQLVGSWQDTKVEYDRLSAARGGAIRGIQDYFVGKLGETKELDERYFDSWNIGSVFVMPHQDGYRMYYTGVNGFNSTGFNIGVAESSDGTTWDRLMADRKSRVAIRTGEKGKSTLIWKTENQVANFLVVVASFAVGLGVINLGKVNAEILFKLKKGWVHSAGFFLGLISMFLIAILYRKSPSYTAGYKLFDVYFNGILLAFGGTSMGLLAFYLASASYRTFKFKGAEAGVMMITAILIMLGQVPIGQWLTRSLPHFLQIQTVSSWILVNINGAAMRAITIGAAAGAMVMSYRLWLSKDRSN